MSALLLVLSLHICCDSMPPPTLLAPGKRDTTWQTPVNPLKNREPYDPTAFVRVQKAVLPKKKNEP